MTVTVLIDAENVRRSRWPNLTQMELVERVRAWSASEGVHALLVFDGAAPVDADDVVGAGRSADDWLAEHAPAHAPYSLVTSDRKLQQRAGRGAERVIGGGAFLEELLRAQ